MKPPASFLNQPVRSLQTMLRTIALVLPDYSGIIPDGLYGPQTRSAVSRFQQLQELPVTGVTDQATWEKITGVYRAARIEALPPRPLTVRCDPFHDLKPEDICPCLYLVQAMLVALADGYGCISQPPLSGKLDSGTRESLSGFQRLCGLTVTGNPDKNTWNHLVLQFTLLAHSLS